MDSKLGPRERLAAGVFLAGALAVRLAFALFVSRTLRWSDAVDFEQAGRQLYLTGSFGNWVSRAPGYPVLIAAIYRVFGPDLLRLRVVEAVLATAGVGLLGVLGVRLFGRRAGLVAMGLAAFHPLLSFLPSTQYSESTSFVVVTLLLLTAYAAFERRSLALWAATGVLGGVATLTRPNALVFLPGLALGFVLLARREGRGWIAPLLVTALAVLLTLTPWELRGHRVTGRWFLVSMGGGRALWLGNNEHASGGTSELPVYDERMRAELAHTPAPAAVDSLYAAEARRFMREHPARTAWLYLRKLGNLFALYPDPATRDYATRLSAWSQGLASLVIDVGLLILLARVRSVPRLWPMLLGSLSFALPTAVAYTTVRYRMFFEPCLLLAAGVGWASVLRRLPWEEGSESRPSPRGA